MSHMCVIHNVIFVVRCCVRTTVVVFCFAEWNASHIHRSDVSQVGSF